MFLAALSSRCRLAPQSGQECHRTDTPLATRTPQPEHIWLACRLRHGGHSSPSVCCFGSEDAQEL